MGSLYHLGQKLVDFANIITRHANRNDTVPSSSLVYKGAKNIATIEDSNVASQAYSVGNFLILDGQLYRVTNAIASGGTITVGTNVTLDSVGSEIKSLNDSLTNLDSRSYIETKWMTFTYYNAEQLVTTWVEPTLPTGWTYRILGFSNIFSNSPVGVKLNGAYLSSPNNQFRAKGSGFTSSDTASILCYYQVYKA